LEQMSCYLTYTNEKTHEIVRKNLHLSPLYAGRIVGIGPRYCPSIEDKVVKFSDKPRHQIYLEPEGRNTIETYVNGLSMSLPQEVQREVVHSIRGLEDAEFVRPAYAIEYDCATPVQIRHSLESKKVENLFFAGQINCTSGYEEAGCQGLMAGFNVIRKFRGQPPFVLDRSEAYIGVLIDDLVTRGTNEPYRMLTSRAEFRLLLRQDNADERLMKYGFELGLVPAEVYAKCQEKSYHIRSEIERLQRNRIGNVTLERFLKRPHVRYQDLISQHLHAEHLTEEEMIRVENEVKYDGYIGRQRMEVNRFKKIEKKQIPEKIDYDRVRGISKEAREKLSKIRPSSIGQASRIPGITRCDLSLLAIHMGKGC